MSTVEKYRAIAAELRFRAEDPRQKDHREQILALARHFDVCADGLDHVIALEHDQK